MGSFEREKKNGQKGACDGAGPTGPKQPEGQMQQAFATQSVEAETLRRGRGGQEGARAWHVFPDLLTTHFLVLVRKPDKTPKDHIYFEPMKMRYFISLPGTH